MPRGRKKKILDSGTLIQKPHKIKKPSKKSLTRLFKDRKARLIDTVTAYDMDLGEKIDINIYRVEPKKLDSDFCVDDVCYMGVNASFIEEISTDLITTPVGVAMIVDPENEDPDEYNEDEDVEE